MKHITKPLGLIIILAILIILGFWYYQHSKTHPNTKDAYVQANVVNIAPQVTGMVAKVYVHDHQFVKKGAPLFTIDQRPFLLAVKKASANLQNVLQQVKAEKAALKTAQAQQHEAHAKLINAQQNTKRILALVKKQLASPSQGDSAVAQLRIARAGLKASQSAVVQAKATLGESNSNNALIQGARAELAQAILNLGYTHITAPANGYVNNFTLRPGAQVIAGQPEFAFVESDHWWVSANYKETDLERIHPGESAKIKIDMYPGHTFNGKVLSISTGSGASFSILPAENASGNWVKVTQRFPVRISIHDTKKFPLRVGASAHVVVNSE